MLPSNYYSECISAPVDEKEPQEKTKSSKEAQVQHRVSFEPDLKDDSSQKNTGVKILKHRLISTHGPEHVVDIPFFEESAVKFHIRSVFQQNSTSTFIWDDVKV